MQVSRAQVLAAINREPDGISSADLAAKLEVSSYAVSSILSKLAAEDAVAVSQEVPRDLFKRKCLA